MNLKKNYIINNIKINILIIYCSIFIKSKEIFLRFYVEFITYLSYNNYDKINT